MNQYRKVLFCSVFRSCRDILKWKWKEILANHFKICSFPLSRKQHLHTLALGVSCCIRVIRFIEALRWSFQEKTFLTDLSPLNHLNACLLFRRFYDRKLPVFKMFISTLVQIYFKIINLVMAQGHLLSICNHCRQLQRDSVPFSCVALI